MTPRWASPRIRAPGRYTKSPRSSWFTFLDGAIDLGSPTSLFKVGLLSVELHGSMLMILQTSLKSAEPTIGRPTSLILLIASHRSDVKFPFFAIN